MAAIEAALGTVLDPELRRPITELGMVKNIEVNHDGDVHLGIYLTIAGCPKKEDIVETSRAAIARVPGVGSVAVELDVMSPAQRAALTEALRGNKSRENPFASPDSLTKVIAVASGKGGVGKSSVAVNLAAAMARDGLKVGIIDADVYGFSIPGLLGIHQKPTRLDDMILPPVAFDIKVISIGMFLDANKPVAWRGPMLHRALEQFTKDVYFGDLDVLLLDLPPGTGDIAISVSQLLPHSEIVVVTTPQLAASSVAQRAGAVAAQTGQRVVGVIENMAGLALPDGSMVDVFGAGGGADVSRALGRELGYEIPLIATIPLEPELRIAGDSGTPMVIAAPNSPAAVELHKAARTLAGRPRGLAGRKLGVSPKN